MRGYFAIYENGTLGVMANSDSEAERLACEMVDEDTGALIRVEFSLDWTADSADEHVCRANADPSGYCRICGAVLSGTQAYYDLFGGEPPGTVGRGIFR